MSDDDIVIQAELSEIHQNFGYAHYKFGYGQIVVNQDFMLGFVLALAEYPDDDYSTIKQAFAHYFSRSDTEKFVEIARDFRANQTEWVRWPSLPLS